LAFKTPAVTLRPYAEEDDCLKTKLVYMALLSIDLGGTKLAAAVFSAEGVLLHEQTVLLEHREGAAVGALILRQVSELLAAQQAKSDPIISIGVSVPGIVHPAEGVVWAPNIPGWEAYPLREEISGLVPGLPVAVDSDRACCILGETWKGRAQGCHDAVFLAVGTGIGAGILVNGQVVRGAHDSAGAIGWMALERPLQEKYRSCGCFESGASGDGLAKVARELLARNQKYRGRLRDTAPELLTAHHVFEAYEEGDEVAREVIGQAIELWGMAVSNIVSLFDPQVVVLGGGVFGPAVVFIPEICAEARKWAQPVSIKKVEVVPSALGSRAALYGAGFLALQQMTATLTNRHV
jgi:glucokinase